VVAELGGHPVAEFLLARGAVVDVVDADPKLAIQIEQRLIPRIGDGLHMPGQPAKQVVERHLLVAVSEQLGAQSIGGRHG
jgi:hypothetical protein